MKWKQTLLAVVLLTAAGSLLFWQYPPVSGSAADPAAASQANADSTSALLGTLSSDPSINPQVLTALRQLQSQLDIQRQHQLELLEQLAALERSTFALDAGEVPDLADLAAEEAEEATTAQATAVPRGRRRQRLSQERLVETGFNAYEADQILTLADTIAMDRLNLQYQATREGWLRTPEYAERMGELPVLRDLVTDEYGDVGYDRYLYASGRSNRLIVSDVYRESPAANMGLQAGDKVIAMAGETVYSDRDLRAIASQGSAGETVSVVIEREGSQFEAYVPRGPLGIRATRGYENPADKPDS